MNFWGSKKIKLGVPGMRGEVHICTRIRESTLIGGVNPLRDLLTGQENDGRLHLL